MPPDIQWLLIKRKVGQCSVILCEWTGQLPNLTWWAHRGMRKARGRAGERALTDCSLLTRLTTLATNGLLARRNNFRDLFFYLNYTKHGGHSFLTKARFYFIALHKLVRASHVVSNEDWARTIAAFKIKNPPTRNLLKRTSSHFTQADMRRYELLASSALVQTDYSLISHTYKMKTGIN